MIININLSELGSAVTESPKYNGLNRVAVYLPYINLHDGRSGFDAS